MKTTLKLLMLGCMTLALLFTSCSKDDEEVTIAAKSIELVSGGSQTATVETALTNPVEVIVKDQNSDAFAGTTVNFVVTEGSVSSATVTTNAAGKASVFWTLGTSVGTQNITVTAFKADGTTALSNSPLSVTATATAAITQIAIGDFLEGGVVFYVDGTGEHGFVCAVSDQDGAEWGCYEVLIDGADGTAIGTGAQNTIDIEVGCTTEATAADLCANLTLNDFSDWFLPSRDELNQMYLNKATIDATATANGGTAFVDYYYWASSEFDKYYAWTQDFTAGGKISQSKELLYDATYNVRAVRAF